ncbi:MAG: precorrin-6A/cobalt-precorrin-6A reductase, partial [Epulopiscium sp.]|nr:precorrin-6A/cobalt-precorrin-6A reductase [Candidatus Epulonipiscium sp.]
MYKLLLFGGTSEGRRLMEYFSALLVQMHICVATEYGEKLLKEYPNCTVFQGRLNQQEMLGKIIQENYDYVLDATHPYATEVTSNIKEACRLADKPYFRILREERECRSVEYVDSVEDAVEYLQNTTGTIFISTGSKELKKFT